VPARHAAGATAAACGNGEPGDYKVGAGTRQVRGGGGGRDGVAGLVGAAPVGAVRRSSCELQERRGGGGIQHPGEPRSEEVWTDVVACSTEALVVSTHGNSDGGPRAGHGG
jgi:hypothetical protein